ncbi:ABC transporter ATP-binding protein [Spiroplasma endosymbiont of Aspidapion aeneum]|uniref:ABC transporter ATP-binding protein n=1 Tax=Spiroplasma endosymbiont of Aspidapion aeneum TaxID=3066276 RepID=UPI00313AEC81
MNNNFKKINNKNKGFLALSSKYAIKYPMIFFPLLFLAIFSGAISVLLSIVLTAVVTCLNVDSYHKSNPNISEMDLKHKFDTGLITIKMNGDQTQAYFLGIGFNCQQWLWVILIIFFLVMIVQTGSILLSGLFAKNIQIGLRKEIMFSLLRNDLSYFSFAKTGELITKITSDTMIIGDQCEIMFSDTISSLTVFFLGSTVIMIVDWRIGLILIAIIFFIVMLIGSLTTTTERYIKKLRVTVTDINSYITDRVASIMLIKSSATEEFEEQKIKSMHKKYIKESFESEIVNASFSTWIWVCVSAIPLITVMIVTFWYKDADNISLVVASFVSIVYVLTGPLVVILKIIPDFVRTKTSIKRVNDIIYAEPRIDVNFNGGIIIDKIEGDIYFKDVSFSYPEKPNKLILPKTSFTFKQGKSYAFVGTTGSGKSTISRLLLRFYDPTEGEIFINNNVKLKDVNLTSFLNRVGYVEQEPQIIYGSVLDNIKYFQEHKTNEEAIEAAKKSKLHDIVSKWKEGYDTILGERGFMLSGGQKQRLVIARMFLKNPDILILDEATSALDNITEREIQKQFDELTIGRTSFIIAHRLTTINKCDEVIVLEGEKGVVQRGSFKELITKDGYFKRLYEAGKIIEEKN